MDQGAAPLPQLLVPYERRNFRPGLRCGSVETCRKAVGTCAPASEVEMAEAAPSKSGTMAGLSLKNIMKIYPHSGDQKKSKKKKGEPEKKTNF